MRVIAITLVILGVLLLDAPAEAHTPYIDDGTHTTPDTAFELEDIEVSRVLYSEVRCPNRPLWIRFEGRAGDRLHLQLGIPALEALAEFRPLLALVGPGLPRLGFGARTVLPFELPDDLGVRIFDSSGVEAPEYFFEPFTRTSSWILLTETVDLPEMGTYYLVAFSDSNMRARLWVTTGTREELALGQVIRAYTGLRRFHRPEAGLGAQCRL